MERSGATVGFCGRGACPSPNSDQPFLGEATKILAIHLLGLGMLLAFNSPAPSEWCHLSSV